VKIERLSFIVSPADKANDFIDADAKVWNPHLQQQKGYIRKTAQVYAGGRVEIQIFWVNDAAQKKADSNLNHELIDRQLQLAFPGVYRLLYSS
jgi:hypothetical protein